VVVSGQVTRKRREDLLAAGATDVIHKDDVDSVRLGEALLRVFVVPSSLESGPAEAGAEHRADARKSRKIKRLKP
jgi:hypothetical protein